jgi:hypothetical protein
MVQREKSSKDWNFSGALFPIIGTFSMTASPAKFVVLAALVLGGLAAVYFATRSAGVMPLDENTLAQFQEANSRANREFLANKPAMPYAVRSAVSVREAINELGYDPDRTLIHWMSAEFKSELNRTDPRGALDKIRLTESLLGTALGDGAGAGEQAEILGHWGREVVEAVRR